jgi:hypothetical protein
LVFWSDELEVFCCRFLRVGYGIVFFCRKTIWNLLNCRIVKVGYDIVFFAGENMTCIVLFGIFPDGQFPDFQNEK